MKQPIFPGPLIVRYPRSYEANHFYDNNVPAVNDKQEDNNVVLSDKLKKMNIKYVFFF